MADNIGYTPGAGATIAADDIGGVLHQRVKVGIGADGVATDISTSNPMPVTSPNALTTQETGEVVEALEALRMAIQSLNKTVGQVLPDATGRMRVNIETGSNVAISTLPTLGTVTTVTTVSTVSNQTQIGGIAAVDQVPALMCIAAQGLRRNITVT
jgi:hypothetical protein